MKKGRRNYTAEKRQTSKQENYMDLYVYCVFPHVVIILLSFDEWYSDCIFSSYGEREWVRIPKVFRTGSSSIYVDQLLQLILLDLCNFMSESIKNDGGLIPFNFSHAPQ